MRIEIIAGSARANSLTLRVAKHLQLYLRNKYHLDSGLLNMQDLALPPVQSVIEKSQEARGKLATVSDRVFQAEAFILVTPEYNGSFSPAMKNFLDHFPKQERKAFGIVSASPGPLGGVRAAIQLQNLVFGLSGIGSPQMLIVAEVDKKFSEDGTLLNQEFNTQTETFLEEFLWLAHAIHYAQLLTKKQVA